MKKISIKNISTKKLIVIICLIIVVVAGIAGVNSKSSFDGNVTLFTTYINSRPDYGHLFDNGTYAEGYLHYIDEDQAKIYNSYLESIGFKVGKRKVEDGDWSYTSKLKDHSITITQYVVMYSPEINLIGTLYDDLGNSIGGTDGGIITTNPYIVTTSPINIITTTRAQQRCTACLGLGDCSNCYGDGLTSNPYTGSKMVCSYCNGTGKCYSCGGTGYKD